MGVCFCTGQCRESGICPNSWEWRQGDRVMPIPTNVVAGRLLPSEACSPGQRIDTLQRRERILIDGLIAVYQHPAATPPILKLVGQTLSDLGVKLPSRWALDH